MIELDESLEFRTSIPSNSDLVAGMVIFLVLIVGNWLVFGKTFTIVSIDNEKIDSRQLSLSRLSF